MRRRMLGNTGVEVPEIGLGAWQLGGDWGPMDDATAQKILATAVDKGVRFIDTADVYGAGLSEQRIGCFLKGCSERIFVATKLGRFPEPGWPKNFSLQIFRRHTENSLKRLGLEVLDLTQGHCIPEEFLHRGELFEWLAILQKEGKIRHFGLSVESVDEALYCLDQPGLASLQIIFNVLRQKPLDLLLEKAAEKKVGLIVRLPLASGLLAGKFSPGKIFPPTDHRHYNADGQRFNVGETFAGIPLSKGIELIEELKTMLPSGLTLGQMALRWILDFAAVSVVIPGATRPQQIEDNTGVSTFSRLPSALHAQIASWYAQRVAPCIRGKY